MFLLIRFIVIRIRLHFISKSIIVKSLKIILLKASNEGFLLLVKILANATLLIN